MDNGWRDASWFHKMRLHNNVCRANETAADDRKLLAAARSVIQYYYQVSPFHHLFSSSVISSPIVYIPCSGLSLFSFLFLLLFSMFVFISVWCHYVWCPRALVVRRLSKSTDLIWFDLKLLLSTIISDSLLAVCIIHVIMFAVSVISTNSLQFRYICKRFCG